jgi:hypothetical protein
MPRSTNITRAWDRPAVVPPVPEGLGTSTVWFGGGRVGVSVADHGGLEEIVYFGAQPLHCREFFRSTARSAYPRVFRSYLLVDERAYTLELHRTEIFPAGYRSRLEIPEEGVSVEHWLVVVNDAFLQGFRVRSNARRRELRLRTALHNYTRTSPEGRTWSDWKKDRWGAWTAEVTDRQGGGPSNTWCGVVSDRKLSARSFHSGKLFFETDGVRSGAVSAAVLFGLSQRSFGQRLRALRRGASAEARAALNAWRARLETTPTMRGVPPAVASFFRQQPLILDSLSLTDVPGAMRASVGHYWVWGWDAMVYGDGYLFGGRPGFVRAALDLYERTADPEKGIAHALNPDLTIGGYQTPAAQGLYGIWLYLYAAHTGDLATVRRHYPFARTLKRDRRHGLCVGASLLPDFPQYAGHNGHDISVFNNSIFYQSARCMEHLAGMMGDAATARSARAAWRASEDAFRKLFWDAKRGYWVDSLDSRSLSPRRSYPSHAILWVTPFARDLVAGREAPCAAFLAEHHAFAGGIRMFPLWDRAFNGDGNQFGQHYPVGSDVAFLNLMAADGRQELLERWLRWVDEFWRQYTVPEGVTVEAENDGPRRPDCPGGKQPFAAKAWQIGLLNGVLGVHFDVGGITAGPGLDRPLALSRVCFQRKRWTIATKGKGPYVRLLRINGKAVRGTCRVPADLSTGRSVHLEIVRSLKPSAAPQLVAADGARISSVEQGANTLRLRLSAPGAVRVWFRARGRCTPTWNGEAIPVERHRSCDRQCVLLVPPAGGNLSGEFALEMDGR